MALEEIDITASGFISGTTMSSDTVSVGGNLLTLTNAYLPSLTATTISGGTIYSGNTDIYNIFQTPGQDFIHNVINVGKSGHVDFTSIKSAIDSITGNSQINQFIVNVGPGTYIEDTITLKSFVRLRGSGIFQTIINVNSPNKTVIVGANISTVDNVIIGGATGATGVGIYYNGTGATPGAMFINDCFFASNHTQIILSAQAINTTIISNNCVFGGVGFFFDKGFEITSTPGNTAQISAFGIRLRASTAPYISTFINAHGTGNTISFKSCELIVNSGVTCFNVYDGADAHLSACLIKGFDNGIKTINSGVAPEVEVNGTIFESVTKNLNIQHTGTTGSFIGYSNILKTFISESASFFITDKDSHIVTVAKKGGDFSSVASALSSITDSNITNRYKVLVGPGVFTEPELLVPSYVSIVGSVIAATTILPNGAHHVFNLQNPNVELSFFGIQSANTGYAGIFVNDTGNFAQAHKVTFTDCDTNVLVQSITKDTYFYGEYIDYNGVYIYGTKTVSSGGFTAFANLENYYNLPSTSASTGTYAQGPNATAHVLASGNDTTSNGNIPLGGTAFYLEDGATMVLSSVDIVGWNKGIHIANVGTASVLRATSVAQGQNITNDLFIDHPNSIGNYQGAAEMDLISINPAAVDFNIVIQDLNNGSLNVSNKLNIRFNNGTLTDMSTLIGEASTMGVMEGGELTAGTGFTVNISDGFGYFEQFPDNDVTQRIDWPITAITLSANVDKYIYFNSNSLLTSNSSEPDTRYNVLLGRVVTNSTGIELIDNSSSDAEHTSNLFSNAFKNAIGPVYASGSIVTESVTPLHLDVGTGIYYFGENVFQPNGGTGITFTSIYGQGSGVVTGQTAVSNTQYDSGGTLTSLSGSYYTKHSIYLVGEGVNEKYYFVYGQNQYSTLLATQQANIPSVPTYFRGSVTLIAGIVVQQGFPNIVQIIDERPVVGFRANGVNASADHLSLLNLNNGDAGHHQFLMLDGSKTMTGNLNMGGNNVFSAGTYNGVIVETHSSRHLPNGADPLSSATAVSLSNLNTEGVANSFSRSDHTHAHATQSGGTTHSLVDSTNAGFMSSLDKIYFDTLSNQLVTKANLSGATFTGAVIAPSLNATTLSGGTIYSGSTDINSFFSSDRAQIATKANLSGATFTGAVIALSLSATTLSGGTIYSGSTDLNSYFNQDRAQIATKANISGDTFTGQVNTPSLSATTLSGGTIYSGSTELSIVVQNMINAGETFVQPGTNTYTGGTNFRPTVSVSAITVNTILASGATTINNTLTVTGSTSLQSLSATTIISGSTDLSVIFGGVYSQLSTKANLSGATFTSGVIAPSLSATTLSGGTLYSGSTELSTVIQSMINVDETFVQSGVNTYTGGTNFRPTINISALTINTLITSGATTINNTLNITGSTTLAALTTTGATIHNNTLTVTGTTTMAIASASTLSASTSVFVSGIKFPVSPVAGYVLTSDANGNASWSASPTAGSGTTKLDLQTVSNQATTPTATGALVDLSGMTLTAKNLGSSATTYYINFTGDFSNSNNAGSSTFIIVKNGTQISGALTNLTNGGAAMAGANMAASISCGVTGVTNGDVIKVQMSASTGTLTAKNKTLTIMGTLSTNLV